MSYPYPELVPVLQFKCTPAQYMRLTAEKIYARNLAFWKIMPSYTYAECPICGFRVKGVANTYGLDSWVTGELSDTIFTSLSYLRSKNVAVISPCPHLLGIRIFVKLHGILPKTTLEFENYNGEIPFIDAHYYFDDFQTFAVLYALPVCQIQGNQFVPAHTVYAMTYFSERPAEIRRRILSSQDGAWDVDPEYIPYTTQSVTGATQAMKDLDNWANRGLLGYMSFSDTGHKLIIGKGTTLPQIYRSIQGIARPYVVHRGELHFR